MSSLTRVGSSDESFLMTTAAKTVSIGKVLANFADRGVGRQGCDDFVQGRGRQVMTTDAVPT